MAEPVRVSVVWAGRSEQIVRELALPSGATIADALNASGLMPRVQARVGIFGRPSAMSTPLRDGDRVEIYRSLKIDPKEARRRRAAGKSP